MLKVSIIIPIYNTEKYLKRCLDSLITQTLKDIEIICIDDYSKDNSLKILNEYANVDNRIKIIVNNENYGSGVSRNRGLEIARGEYIQFVDSDDYLDKNALLELYDYAKKVNAELCFYKTNIIASQDTKLLRVPLGIINSYPKVYSGTELLEKFVENEDFFYYPCLTLFNRLYLKKNNLFFKNLVIGEGGDFVLRALIHANVTVVNDGKYYNYFIHSESVTGRNNDKNTILLGQIVQYISILKYVAYTTNLINDIGINTFLNYQYSRIIGGIANLSYEENSTILEKLEDIFSKHIFSILSNSRKSEEIILSDKEINLLKQNKNVILYGAGNIVGDMLQLINKYGLILQGIAVSSKKNNPSVLYGHRVYEIMDLVPYAKQCIVLVAVKRKYYQEIRDLLEKLGFKKRIFLS